MRFALLAAVLVLSSPAVGQMSKEDCSTLAGPIGRGGTAALSFVDGMNKASLERLTKFDPSPLASAAARAEEARRAALPSMKAYGEALEDLAHQLRVCAR